MIIKANIEFKAWYRLTIQTIKVMKTNNIVLNDWFNLAKLQNIVIEFLLKQNKPLD